MKNTIWNISFSALTFIIAITEKTIDAAPLRPDQATNNCCDILLLKGVIIANTAKGLATKVRKIAIKIAIPHTSNIFDG